MRATESAPPADLGASEKDLAMPSTKAFEDRYGSSVQGEQGELDILLGSAEGRQKLLKVATGLFCPENVLFMDVYYRLAECSDREGRMAAARELVERFLLPHAPDEVNVEHRTRLAMQALHGRLLSREMEDCGAECFGRVFQEVRAMVAQTVWPHCHASSSSSSSSAAPASLAAAAPSKRRRGGCLSR